MSESQGQRVIVANTRDQPVELYLHAQPVVLPAYGRIELDAADLVSPQVEALLRRQLISVLEAAAPEAAAEEGTSPAEEAAAEDAAPPAEEAAPPPTEEATAPTTRTRRRRG